MAVASIRQGLVSGRSSYGEEHELVGKLEHVTEGILHSVLRDVLHNVTADHPVVRLIWHLRIPLVSRIVTIHLHPPSPVKLPGVFILFPLTRPVVQQGFRLSLNAKGSYVRHILDRGQPPK